MYIYSIYYIQRLGQGYHLYSYYSMYIYSIHTYRYHLMYLNRY